MTHVTIGKSLDWQQMGFDQSVRGMRVQVDKDNDVYAVPVIMIDPTGTKKVSAQGVCPGGIWCERQTITTGPTFYPVHIAPDGMDSYVLGLTLDYADSTFAAAALAAVAWCDNEPPVYPVRYFHYFHCAAAAAFRNSLVVPFGEKPLRFAHGVQGYNQTSFAGATGVVLGCWGYDA